LKGLALSTVCFAALLTTSGGSIAQDLDATWLAGRWQGDVYPVRALAVAIGAIKHHLTRRSSLLASVRAALEDAE